MIRTGEIRRSVLTGKIYEVKTIKDRGVVLESLDGSNQVWTERGNLRLFYEKIENEEHLNGSESKVRLVTIS